MWKRHYFIPLQLKQHRDSRGAFLGQLQSEPRKQSAEFAQRIVRPLCFSLLPLFMPPQWSGAADEINGRVGAIVIKRS